MTRLQDLFFQISYTLKLVNLCEKDAIESIMGKGWHTWPFDVSRASFTSLSVLAGEQGNPVTPHSTAREQTDGHSSVSQHFLHLLLKWIIFACIKGFISCCFDSVNIKELFNDASCFSTVLTNLSVQNESVSWMQVQTEIFILKR